MPWYFLACMYLCGEPWHKAAGDIMRAQKKCRVKQETQTHVSLLIIDLSALVTSLGALLQSKASQGFFICFMIIFYFHLREIVFLACVHI